MEEKKKAQKKAKNVSEILPKDDVKAIQKKLYECEKLCKEYLDGWKRTKADVENEKKQNNKRIESESMLIKRNFSKELLPVFDSIQLALSQGSEDKTLIFGVEKIKSQYMKLFLYFGVEILEPLGEKFDPHQHEAVGGKEVEEEKDNTVVKVIRVGAKIQSTIVRPAMVYVGTCKK